MLITSFQVSFTFNKDFPVIISEELIIFVLLIKSAIIISFDSLTGYGKGLLDNGKGDSVLILSVLIG